MKKSMTNLCSVLAGQNSKDSYHVIVLATVSLAIRRLMRGEGLGQPQRVLGCWWRDVDYGRRFCTFVGIFQCWQSSLERKKREKKGGKYEALNRWVSAYMQTARSCASIVL
jgi:hypothetical protein